MLLLQLHHRPWLNIINSAFQQKRLDQIALQFLVRNKISSHCVQTKPGAAGQIWDVNNTSQVGVEESTLITRQWISTTPLVTITHSQVIQGGNWSGRTHAVSCLFIRQVWWLNLQCQLDWILNHMGDTVLGVLGRVELRREDIHWAWCCHLMS